MKLLAITLAVLLGWGQCALAQSTDQPRYRVYVSDDASVGDVIGKNLIYKVKRLLRKSRQFLLVETPEETCLYMSIQTTSYDEDNNATIYDVVWLLVDREIQIKPFFLDGSLGVSGISRLDNSAAGIVETTERIAAENSALISTCQRAVLESMR